MATTAERLKAAMVLAMLYLLGVKPSYLRQHLSDGNACAGSLFCKGENRRHIRSIVHGCANA